MVRIEQIAGRFGRQELPHALFYEFEFGLRFELGGDESDTIPRFLRAIERASEILEPLLGQQHSIIVAFSVFDGRKRSLDHELKLMNKMTSSGMDASRFDYSGAVAQKDEAHIKAHGEDLYRHWYSAPVSSRCDLQKLIWLSVAWGDIRPNAHAHYYIVDTGRDIIANIYDDRGMDIVALKPEYLKPIYDKHKNWLLDYDRQKIDATFQL